MSDRQRPVAPKRGAAQNILGFNRTDGCKGTHRRTDRRGGSDADADPRSLVPKRDPARSAQLMATLDAVNARHGRGTVRPLATGLAWSWGTRQIHLSPRYTTQVGELMEAEAW